MKTTGEKLVYMANQIGDFFKSYPHDQAVKGIKEHIEKFWDPRMLNQIYAMLEQPDNGLKPYALEALQILAREEKHEHADVGGQRMSPDQDLTPAEVAERVKQGAVLIDVREPAEFEAERIAGAQLFPLSTLDPAKLPQDAPLIFQCGTGKRSSLALARAQQAGLPHDAHLAGGIQAWKAAGLPTIVGK